MQQYIIRTSLQVDQALLPLPHIFSAPKISQTIAVVVTLLVQLTPLTTLAHLSSTHMHTRTAYIYLNKNILHHVSPDSSSRLLSFDS